MTNGWGIYGLNKWGSYGKVSYRIGGCAQTNAGLQGSTLSDHCTNTGFTFELPYPLALSCFPTDLCA